MPGAGFVTLAKRSIATPGSEAKIQLTRIPAVEFVVTALHTNDGAVFLGDSNVAADRYAYRLQPGQSVSLRAYDRPKGKEFFNLDDFYFDVEAANDEICVSYVPY